MAAVRARRWAAFALVLVGPATALLVDAVRPEPSGHWSGHLAVAALSAGVAAAVVLGSLLVRDHLPRTAVAAIALTLVGLALEVVGNFRAAQSLWATSYDDSQVGLVGPLHPGYEWGHQVAAWGDNLVIVGGLALAVILGVCRRVRPSVAVVGGIVAVFPPWIYPALGVLLLLAWLYATGPWRIPVSVAEQRKSPTVTPRGVA